jgi:hypothetical protein
MGWNRPPLTAEQILGWADDHYARTGEYPRATSGPVAGATGENWAALNNALCCGLRGLPGGDSVPRLLVRYGRLRGLWARLTRGAWSEAEDSLVRTLAPAQAARRTGRTLRAVYARRFKLARSDGR